MATSQSRQIPCVGVPTQLRASRPHRSAFLPRICSQTSAPTGPYFGTIRPHGLRTLVMCDCHACNHQLSGHPVLFVAAACTVQQHESVHAVLHTLHASFTMHSGASYYTAANASLPASDSDADRFSELWTHSEIANLEAVGLPSAKTSAFRLRPTTAIELPGRSVRLGSTAILAWSLDYCISSARTQR